MNFKEMVYSSERTDGDILARGNIDGYEYLIVSYGTHPCAYVAIPENHSRYKDYHKLENEDTIYPHGGVTFSGSERNNIKGHWIGWDYHHACDFSGYSLNRAYSSFLGRKQWTTAEIYDEVCGVIEQLKQLE